MGSRAWVFLQKLFMRKAAQREREMFYGLEEGCSKMLGPGGMLFLQEDPGHFLWKNIWQAKWLFQVTAP